MTSLPASLRFGQLPAKATAPAGAARRPGSGGGSPAGGGGRSKDAWAGECERVASQLVIAVPAPDPTAASNWRLQLERARFSLAGLQAAAPAAREEVEGAAERLAAAAAALEASEAAAGAELGGLREQHRAALAAVATLQQEWDSRREYVGQLEAELVFLNKELEERQREVAEQGDSMSDTRPVARLAEACAALRAEIAQMKVRRGVLQAALLGAAART